MTLRDKSRRRKSSWAVVSHDQVSTVDTTESDDDGRVPVACLLHVERKDDYDNGDSGVVVVDTSNEMIP